ncbi:hypothetical protein HI113_17400 [Corallococcus exiguus]|uniref:site-2 protease family protein n=1 Tax=Corallococcus TaxID=83461 RepID=UPI000EC58512|nr:MULTISPECIES: site-2 protease family protein [Corallococcus]NNB90765.1 hypothetical protein [Corallococcus exiguus]NNB95674.1 hypothetical protein [Corallococcus exiguus]NPC47948.1 hypothetical protein [Corallococcus exiguus]RKH79045.1 hypothetical protein D7X99_26245 [Corallococcus sp. AB032C]
MSWLDHAASVTVHPFTRQAGSDEVVIGPTPAGRFLSLPLEAVALLDELALGKTVSEARTWYESRYGEEPDIEGLLEHLSAYGIVSLPGTVPQPAPSVTPAATRPTYHLTFISERVARFFFGRVAVALYGAVILAGVVALVTHPGLLPTWRALFIPEHITATSLLVMFLSLSTLALHELAHLVAARSRGVSCRLGFGNRLWTLVAETDMTGVWALPRSQRFLPILAGPIYDAVCASLVLLVLLASQKGLILLSEWMLRIGTILLFIHGMRLLWQCYFYVRTDFYYALTTFWDCKDLMQDTEDFLRNQLARLRGRSGPVDQSHIPQRERRVIARYSAVWLAGRMLAFGLVFFVQVPLIIHYLPLILRAIAAGLQGGLYAFLDSLFVITVWLVTATLGLTLWIRELRTPARRPTR